jgi:hypothetical protein
VQVELGLNRQVKQDRSLRSAYVPGF